MQESLPRSEKPIRVMYLLTSLAVGGAQRLILDLIRHIDREHFEVVVAMLGGPRTLVDDFKNLGVEVIDFEAKNKLDFPAFWRLYRYLTQFPPDLLHVHSPFAGIVVRLMRKLVHIPVIIHTEQNVESAYHPLTRLGHRLTLPLVDVFTGITRTIEELYYSDSAVFSAEEWHKGRRHFTIYSGVDTARMDRVLADVNPAEKRAALGYNSRFYLMACTARLHPNKGHIHLLKAMQQIKAQYPDMYLLLLGDGPLEDTLKQTAIDFDVADRVSFLGHRTDVYEILSCVDCYVMPSINEGFGIALTEAMAVSLPTVITDLAVFHEIVTPGETSLVVPPASPDALAEALMSLRQDSVRRQRMGRAARQRVDECFSIERVAIQYQQLYDLAAEDAPGRKTNP